MSIATQISRILGLRNRLRAKINSLGIDNDTELDLDGCVAAVEFIGGTQQMTEAFTYYDVAAKQYAIVSDSALTASNIVSGATILGVAGTAHDKNVTMGEVKAERGTTVVEIDGPGGYPYGRLCIFCLIPSSVSPPDSSTFGYYYNDGSGSFIAKTYESDAIGGFGTSIGSGKLILRINASGKYFHGTYKYMIAWTKA